MRACRPSALRQRRHQLLDTRQTVLDVLQRGLVSGDRWSVRVTETAARACSSGPKSEQSSIRRYRQAVKGAGRETVSSAGQTHSSRDTRRSLSMARAVCASSCSGRVWARPASLCALSTTCVCELGCTVLNTRAGCSTALPSAQVRPGPALSALLAAVGAGTRARSLAAQRAVAQETAGHVLTAGAGTAAHRRARALNCSAQLDTRATPSS